MNILTQVDNTDKDQWTRDRRSIDFNEPLNTVENDFFGFPKVKWLHLTGEVDKSVRVSCAIFSGINVPKNHLKIG